MPIAQPTKILDKTNCATLCANEENIEPKIKTRLLKRRTFFLPNLSINLPFIKAPNTAPIETALTKKPNSSEERENVFFIYSKTPDITPVSNPAKIPPNEAKSIENHVKELFFIVLLYQLCK